ncbi:MAG TPA: rod shape-determining protein MreC [Bacteroidia bacterium]|nr:rod shape-determining protein MreC [Bacteroidia bacterium]
MRTLFLFLWKYNFFLLFLLLETLCFYLIVANNNFHRSAFINSTLSLSTSVQGGMDSFRSYLNLRESNKKLLDENAYLRSLTPSAYVYDSASEIKITDTLRHQQYSFIGAHIISNSVNHRKNYLLLDKGSSSGIRSEMGVIGSRGVIGIVKDVSEHYCSVMSFLHKDSRVSARFRKNAYFGSLTWDGRNPLFATLSDVPKHVAFLKGDTVETSSYSSVYPEGVLIGTVEEIRLDAGGNFFICKIKLFEDFQKLSNVYVVNYLFKEERKSIEEKIRDAQ